MNAETLEALDTLLSYVKKERQAAYNDAGLAQGRAKQDIHRSRAVAMGDVAAPLSVIVQAAHAEARDAG